VGWVPPFYLTGVFPAHLVYVKQLGTERHARFFTRTESRATFSSKSAPQAVRGKCANAPRQVWRFESRQNCKKPEIPLWPKDFSCPFCQTCGNQVRHQIPGENLLSSKYKRMGWMQPVYQAMPQT